MVPGEHRYSDGGERVGEGTETMRAVMKEIPMGRLARAEEIASAVLWLCSPGAGFIVGQVIVPDGGYTARQPDHNIQK
jgi:NAD(P)-dependent dehydrogenase (short-subunit alcohol dehydrogenase family)